MDYTPNIDAQGMRRPMGPVDQPNWSLQHLSVLRTSILLISYVQLLFLHLQFQIHTQTTGLDATVDQVITVAAN